jgi:ParB/RepB/Spo0J family partition protein
LSIKQEQSSPPQYESTEQVFLIPIAKLFIGSINKRRVMDRRSIEELKQSILAKSRIIEPLDVRPTEDDRFEIVDGTRRFTASTELLASGVIWLNKLPCLVRMLSKAEAEHESFLANLHHKTFTPYELAKGMKDQMTEFPELYPTKEALAKSIGKSHQFVSQIFPLADLDEKVGERIRDNPTDEERAVEQYLLTGHGLLIAKAIQDVRVKEALADKNVSCADFQIFLADAIYKMPAKDAEEKVREMKAELLDEAFHKKPVGKKKRYKHSKSPSTSHVIELSESEENKLTKAVSTSNISAEKLLHAYVITGIEDTLAAKRR